MISPQDYWNQWKKGSDIILKIFLVIFSLILAVMLISLAVNYFQQLATRHVVMDGIDTRNVYSVVPSTIFVDQFQMKKVIHSYQYSTEHGGGSISIVLMEVGSPKIQNTNDFKLKVRSWISGSIENDATKNLLSKIN